MKVPFLFANGVTKALFDKAKTFFRKISFFPLVLFIAFLPYRVLKISNSTVLSQLDIVYILLLFVFFVVMAFNAIPLLVNTRCFQLFFFYCLVLEEKFFSENKKEALEGKAFFFLTALWMWHSHLFMLFSFFFFGLYTHMKNQFFQLPLLESEIKTVDLRELPFEKLMGLVNIVAIKLFKKNIEVRIANDYRFTSIPKRYFSTGGPSFFQRVTDVKNVLGVLGISYIVDRGLDYIFKRGVYSPTAQTRSQVVSEYQNKFYSTTENLNSSFPVFKEEWRTYTHKLASSSKGLPPLTGDLPPPLFKLYDERTLNDFCHFVNKWNKVLDINVDFDQLKANGIPLDLFNQFEKIKMLEAKRTDEVLSLAILAKFDSTMWNTVYLDIVGLLKANDVFMQKFIWHLRGMSYNECLRFCTLFVNNFVSLPSYWSPIVNPFAIRDGEKIEKMFSFIDEEMKTSELICEATTLGSPKAGTEQDLETSNPDYFPGSRKAILVLDEESLKSVKKIKGPDTKAPSIRSDWWFSDFF